MPATIILSRDDVNSLIDRQALFESIKAAFVSVSGLEAEFEGRRTPVRLPSPAPTGADGMLLSPGLIPGVPAYTVKVNSKFPNSRPAIKGVVVLHSLEDGRVLAILESSSVTAARTAAAGAIGTDILARTDATRAGVIGCGTQGRVQLEELARVRSITRAYVHDTDPSRTQAFAETQGRHLKFDVLVCSTAQEVARNAEILITATWAREPLLFPADISPGTHITTLGADGPGECEVSADLIRQSRFFADNTKLQVEMGAIGGAGLDASAVAAEIGAVLAGTAEGRRNNDEITVYGMVGLPFQDLAAAWLLYNDALNQGKGTKCDLL